MHKDKMTYCEAVEYVKTLKNRGIVPGLENMQRLCRELGNPQDSVKMIHIAGTNGKGSVGAYISSVLVSGGYTAGRYVSPAVEDVREIYRLNGEWIDKNDYAECIATVKKASEIIEKEGFFPTSFEVETAAAFVYFNMKNCDYAVVECGMGGRLDATNVISAPRCSVITHIAMDHTAFLGGSIEAIATEKAGIIKPCTPVVSAVQSDAAADVIKSRCKELSSECVFAENPRITDSRLNGIKFEYKGLQLYTSLSGLYQAENAALAVEAVKSLGIGISDKSISDGIKNARWDYRFEVHYDNKYWIFDGAHNPDGARRLSETVGKYFPDGRIVYIFGVFSDKDYEKIAELTAGRASRIYTVTPPSARGLDSTLLACSVKKYCSDVIPLKSISEAAELCGKESCRAVICFGSLSFLNEIKKKKGF